MALAGRQIIGETLRVIRADLELRLVPNLTDPDALRSAQMIDGLLSYLSAWHLSTPDLMPEFEAALEGLAPAGGTSVLISEFPVAGERLGDLAEALETTVESGGLPEPGKAAAILDAAASVYRQERAAVSQGSREALERLAASEVDVSPALATTFLQSCLGPGHLVREVARAPGGFSKDTLFLSGSDRTGAPAEFVVRRDLPFGPGETRVREEHRLLTALVGQGVPLAEPLGLDIESILGQPAMISRRVQGSSGTESWDQDPKVRGEVCRNLAHVLAKLHRIDPAALGLAGSARDPRAQQRAYVEEWHDRWRRNRVHPSATMAAGFAWLLENIPREIDQLSIVHGDVGFHNAMVHENEIVAVLDWEFAHLGDATEDLSYCRPMIEPLVPWDDFIGAYREAGGHQYRAENAAYFDVWRSVRNATTCATAWRGFVSGAYPALKMAYQGVPLYRFFVEQVAITLKERL